MSYNDLIGIPFKAHGRNINEGFDCYGLVKEVFMRHGIAVPEYDADFRDMKKINALIRGNTQGYPWAEIDRHHLVTPALVAMRFGSPQGVVNHTGVYIGGGRFIHAREKIGVCIDHIGSPAWKRTIVGFYKYVGDDK